MRAELERQSARIERLEQERRPEQAPWVWRVTGYIQLDFTLYSQASRDEIAASSGLPLNQDRFTPRRGHVRLEAEAGALGGVFEIDANTVTAVTLRPVDVEFSLSVPAQRQRADSSASRS